MLVVDVEEDKVKDVEEDVEEEEKEEEEEKGIQISANIPSSSSPHIPIRRHLNSQTLLTPPANLSRRCRSDFDPSDIYPGQLQI